MRGSLEDYKELVSMVEADPPLLSNCLVVIYRHLQVTTIPRQSTSSALDTKSRLAILSLRLLGVPHTRKMIHDLTRSIKDNWTHIWRWSAYLVETYLASTGSGIIGTLDSDQMGNEIHRVTMRVFYKLVHIDGFLTFLNRPDDMIRLLTRVWMSESKILAEYFMSASNPLSAVIRSSNPETAASLPDAQFLTYSGVSSDEVADMMLRFISRAIRQRRIQALPLYGHLGMLMSTVLDAKQTIFRPLLPKGSISVVLGVMAHLTSRKSSYDHHEATVQILQICATYMEVCIMRDGFARVLEVLRGRLIMYIFKSARTIWTMAIQMSGSDELGEEYYARLLKAITPFLVYPPILRQARKSIKTIDALGLQTLLTPSSTHAFASAWAVFRDYTQNRTQHNISFDSIRKVPRPHDIFCSNTSVCHFLSLYGSN